MENNINQCPRCKNYIIGDFCFTCNHNISEYKINTDSNSEDIPDFLKDIVGGDING